MLERTYKKFNKLNFEWLKYILGKSSLADDNLFYFHVPMKSIYYIQLKNIHTYFIAGKSASEQLCLPVKYVI